MTEQKNHYEALKAELKTVPAEDVQERALLDRRIKAVYTSTVDGVYYTNTVDIYCDMQREYDKISNLEKNPNLRRFTEKFMLLNDLAMQHDAFGVGRASYVKENAFNLGKEDEELGEMFQLQSKLNKAHDQVKGYRLDDPKYITVTPDRNDIFVSTNIHFSSIEYDQKIEQQDPYINQYRELLSKALENNDIDMKVTGGKRKDFGSDVYIIRPEFSFEHNTLEGQKTILALKNIEDQMLGIRSSNPQTEAALRDRQDKKLESVRGQASYNNIMHNKTLSDEEKEAILDGLKRQAEKFEEESSKRKQNAPKETDSSMKALDGVDAKLVQLASKALLPDGVQGGVQVAESFGQGGAKTGFSLAT